MDFVLITSFLDTLIALAALLLAYLTFLGVSALLPKKHEDN